MIRPALAAAALTAAAAPAGAQTAAGPPVCHAGSAVPSILVQITGLKDRGGDIRVELYPANDADFLANAKQLVADGKPFRRVQFGVPATGHPLACLAAPAPGRYALAVIHSRDGIRKFNFRRDGVAFPGDPKLFLGKPPVRKATITVPEGTLRLVVRLQYYDGFLGVGPVRRPVDP